MSKPLLFSCLSLIFWSSLQSQSQAEQNGKTYALVVGIAAYEDRNIPNLNYSNRDAMVFADWLSSPAGGSVPQENIRLLIDSAATTITLYTSLDWLRNKCEKDQEEFPGSMNTVYFYFSGHGDLESQFFRQLGYLLCYNTSANNYRNNALKLEDLNDFANKLSVDLNSKVILITDACHSGKLTGSDNGGAQLVGRALSQAHAKEIRITACLPDQLSYEDAAWDGGRGVFSYYLLNGLKGLADKNNDKSITLQEIKSFLEFSFETDATLKKDNKKQTPVLKGNQEARLAVVHPETFVSLQKATMPAPVIQSDRDFFFSLLKKREFLEALDFVNLQGLKEEKLFEKLIGQLSRLTDSTISMQMLNRFSEMIIDASGEHVKSYIRGLKNYDEAKDFIGKIREAAEKNSPGAKVFGVYGDSAHIFIIQLNAALQVYQQRMEAIRNLILSDKETLQSCIEEMIESIHNNGQHLINLYLRGDVAELEKRAYYNANKSRYEVYPELYKLALQIVPADIPLAKMLRINQYYFSGLVLRMKIPMAPPAEQSRLVDMAFKMQQEALALDPELAFVHNELGIIYWAKRDFTQAIRHFINATELSPDWPLPWANLCGLYAHTKKFDKALEAGKVADSLGSNLGTTADQLGYLYEQTNNLLFAEEYYRKSTELSSQHYFPFERLGHLYLKATNYAQADSFFHEAEKRKKGYQFKGNDFTYYSVLAPAHHLTPVPCPYDTNLIRKNDIVGLFNWGMERFFYRDADSAEKIFKRILPVDPGNPLVFHYLGKIYYGKKHWEKAELMFRFALKNYLDQAEIDSYLDSINKKADYRYDAELRKCFEKFFKAVHYDRDEDEFFLASVYERWSHPDEAEKVYRRIIKNYPWGIAGYVKLWRLMELQGRYTEAEQLIREYESRNKNSGGPELSAFYQRMMERYPAEGTWPYKLGLYLYENAFGSTYMFLDTVIYFPLLNKEVFLGLDEYSRLYDDKKMRLDINTHKDFAIPYRIEELSQASMRIELPGTKEEIYLATGPIYTPRKEAIHFLKIADSLVQEEKLRADINFKIGNLYLRSGSGKMAFPHYELSVKLEPNNSNARLKLAEVGRNLYKNRASLQQLDYLYGQGQINFPARLVLAEYSIHEGNIKKAEKILAEAQQIYPYPVPAVFDLQGRLNYFSKKMSLSISNYQSFLKYHPDNPGIYYNIARSYQGAGNKKQAMYWLQEAIDLGFNYSYVLMHDEAWKNNRNTAEWNKIMKSLKSKEYH